MSTGNPLSTANYFKDHHAAPQCCCEELDSVILFHRGQVDSRAETTSGTAVSSRSVSNSPSFAHRSSDYDFDRQDEEMLLEDEGGFYGLRVDRLAAAAHPKDDEVMIACRPGREQHVMTGSSTGASNFAQASAQSCAGGPSSTKALMSQDAPSLVSSVNDEVFGFESRAAKRTRTAGEGFEDVTGPCGPDSDESMMIEARSCAPLIPLTEAGPSPAVHDAGAQRRALSANLLAVSGEVEAEERQNGELPATDEASAQMRTEGRPDLTEIIQGISRLDKDILDKIDHSAKVVDGVYEYRHVTLPRSHGFLDPDLDDSLRDMLFTESEWRALGIRQTRGWEHYGFSRYEANVFLFRRPLGTDPRTGKTNGEASKRVTARLNYTEEVRSQLDDESSPQNGTIRGLPYAADGLLRAVPAVGTTNWTAEAIGSANPASPTARRNLPYTRCLTAGIQTGGLFHPPASVQFDLPPRWEASVMTSAVGESSLPPPPPPSCIEELRAQAVLNVDRLMCALHVPLFVR